MILNNSKVLKYYLLFIMLICLYGCGSVKKGSDTGTATGSDAEPVKPAIKQEKCTDLDGNVTITDYDIDGKPLKEESFSKNGSVNSTRVYTYDDEGRLLTNEVIYTNGQSLFEKNEYDEDGNLTGEYRSEDGGDLILIDEYIYDSGMLKTEYDYFFSGELYHIYEYEYDGDLLIKKYTHSEDGYIYRTWEYEYDDSGKCTKMTDSRYESKDITLYNEADQVISEEHYYNGEFSFSTEYKYNDYGVTEYIFKDDDGSEKVHTKTYYNDKGKREKETRLDENGNEIIVITWEYDEQGNMIHSLNLKGYEYTAEYNEYGYPVHVHDVCTDGLRNAGIYDITLDYEYVYYE